LALCLHDISSAHNSPSELPPHPNTFLIFDGKKQILRVTKLHQKLTNQRDDFLHKLSRFYVDNYNLIAIEDLNIKGMTRNHYLARSILDASWSKFFNMLSYKAESAGKVVKGVNPRGISKEYKYGEELDRDYNASLNILERGMLGQGLTFVPSEIVSLRELRQVSASSIVEGGSPLR
jgi:putative transposase